MKTTNKHLLLSALYLQACSRHFGLTRVGNRWLHRWRSKDQYKNIPRGITIGMFSLSSSLFACQYSLSFFVPVDTLEHIYKSQNMVAA
jgi:hypothetical protein